MIEESAFEQVHSGQYELYRIRRPDFPEFSFVMRSGPSQHILYNPHIAGKKLQDSMQEVSVLLMDAIKRTALKGIALGSICELVFLAGGLYYELNHGFKKTTSYALPQCFIGIKRQRVEGSEGEFTAAATYENFESLPDNATVLIGDTIATGATLQKGINILVDAAEERNYGLRSIVMCTLAGSVVGARKLKEIEARLRNEFPDFKLYFFACEQFFHLMPDGTDLRFLCDGAAMPDETRKKTLEVYGEFLGKEMKCAVFDWGTRCKNPKRHYDEFLEFCDGMLQRNPDARSRGILLKMKKETEDGLEDFKKMFDA